MVESVLFSFSRVDRFLKMLIDDPHITTALFDGVTKNFRVVLVEACEDNIQDNLLSDGSLDESKISVINGTDSSDGLCSLLWNDGVNNNVNISINDANVHWSLDDKTYLLKGAFIVLESTGRVLAYSINNAPMTVKTGINLPMDGMVWSIYTQLFEG